MFTKYEDAMLLRNTEYLLSVDVNDNDTILFG